LESATPGRLAPAEHGEAAAADGKIDADCRISPIFRSSISV
jgi:hypothetical protein